MRRRASGGDIHLPYSPWSKLLVRATAQLFDFQPGPAKFLVSNRVVGHVSAGLPIGHCRLGKLRPANWGRDAGLPKAEDTSPAGEQSSQPGWRPTLKKWQEQSQKPEKEGANGPNMLKLQLEDADWQAKVRVTVCRHSAI